tara:strand:- start:6420 stop:7283 length:864 start_codon:yes stop_codon:yes gene_type:complete
MGNAKFYFYPSPSQTPYLATIDLGEGLAELYSDYDIDAQDGVSYTGRRYRTVGRVSEMVRVQRDRMISGEDKYRDLMTLQSHLDRGGSTALCSDADKSYATFLTHPAKAGDTVIRVSSNILRNIVGNKIVAANDYLMIETQNPAMVYQLVKVQSITATATAHGTITLTNPILYDFDTGVIGVRYYRFWPNLKRPANNLSANMISNERGFLFSLDVMLTPDYFQYFSNFLPVGNELGELTNAFGDAATSGADSVLASSGFISAEEVTNTSDIGTSLITEPTIEPKIAT